LGPPNFADFFPSPLLTIISFFWISPTQPVVVVKTKPLTLRVRSGVRFSARSFFLIAKATGPFNPLFFSPSPLNFSGKGEFGQILPAAACRSLRLAALTEPTPELISDACLFASSPSDHGFGEFWF